MKITIKDDDSALVENEQPVDPIVLETLDVTANDSYYAPDGVAYNVINVDVPTEADVLTITGQSFSDLDIDPTVIGDGVFGSINATISIGEGSISNTLPCMLVPVSGGSSFLLGFGGGNTSSGVVTTIIYSGGTVLCNYAALQSGGQWTEVTQSFLSMVSDITLRFILGGTT